MPEVVSGGRRSSTKKVCCVRNSFLLILFSCETAICNLSLQALGCFTGNTMQGKVVLVNKYDARAAKTIDANDMRSAG